MSARTPEPWRLDSPVDRSAAVVDEEYHVICGGEWGRPGGTGFRLSGVISTADALLVTAAPDLLRELRNVLELAERWPFLSVGMLVEHHSRIRETIEKATAGAPGLTHDGLYAAAQALADEVIVSSERGSDPDVRARRVLDALHELIPGRMDATPLEGEEVGR